MPQNEQNHLQKASEFPTISLDSVIQAEYVAMRRAGESHNMAELLALQLPPAERTNRGFLAGRVGTHGFDSAEESGRMIAAARRIDPTFNPNGKVYISQLCREGMTGDPQAWVSDTSDVRRVAEKDNLRIPHLGIDFARHDAPPVKSVGLRPGIVNRLIDQYKANDPSLASKPRQELVEMVKEKHQYAKDE